MSKAIKHLHVSKLWLDISETLYLSPPVCTPRSSFQDLGKNKRVNESSEETFGKYFQTKVVSTFDAQFRDKDIQSAQRLPLL